MKISLDDLLGIDDQITTPEATAARMALDFEYDVFCRMKELGYTQKKLAEILGVSAPTVSSMLSENSNLTLKSIARIATALGCDVSSPSLEERVVTASSDEETIAAVATVKEGSFVSFGLRTGEKARSVAKVASKAKTESSKVYVQKEEIAA